MSSLCTLDIRPLSNVELLKIFFPFSRYHYVLLMVFVFILTLLSLIRSLINLWSQCLCCRYSVSCDNEFKLVCTFFFIMFSVSSFMLMYLIHVYLSFVQFINMGLFALFCLQTSIRAAQFIADVFLLFFS